MTWMKNFPKERKPFFLYILNTHMISVQTANEQEKSLMQTLAYRTFSKAVKDKQKLEGKVSSAGREINSFEDLSLLLRVYRAQERYAEADEIITDPCIGFDAYVGGYKWELVGQYMELLSLQRRWGDLRDVCATVLKEARDREPEKTRFGFGKLGDDWKTWKTLLNANAKDDTTE